MTTPETLGLHPQVGTAEQSLHGQDTLLVDEQLNLYGVFDGLGGHANSEEAARIASESIQASIQLLSSEYTDATSLEKMLIDLADSVSKASQDIIDAEDELQQRLGLTTATVARLVEKDGETALLWASVGDSRLYIRTPDNEIAQVSQDEGEDNWVANSLGRNYFKGVSQKEILLPIQPGDEIILVTDGITGDVGEDILGDEEILSALASSPTAQEASQELINISRKKDDKTAIVIRV